MIRISLPNLLRLILGVTLAMLATLSQAGDIKAWDAASFDALTQSGKPVAIAVHASWCTTCKAQKPIQQELMRDPAFHDVTMLIVDFDGDQKVLERFSVRAQSTLIVFKGRVEVGRSVGDTTRAGMAALLQKGTT